MQSQKNQNHKTKEIFDQELEQVYKMIQTSSAQTYDFFHALRDPMGYPKQREFLESLCTKYHLEPTQSALMALAQRFINLREDSFLQILKLSPAYQSLKTQEQNAFIKKSKNDLLQEVIMYYQKKYEGFILDVAQSNLLDEFYREILHSTHNIGLAMNTFFQAWNSTLLDSINPHLTQTYGFTQALKLLQPTLEKDSEGNIAGRCYSIPKADSKPDTFSSCAYIKAFPNEVDSILQAIKKSIAKLEVLEDRIYNQKKAYLDYFKALYNAWQEADEAKLIAQWQAVDFAWLQITTPFQIAHPFEYYEDVYRHSVAPEWDLRLQNPQGLQVSKTKENIYKLFTHLCTELKVDRNLQDFVEHSLSQTNLYQSIPALFYGAENNGLFSAQVVPNDEFVSSKAGKKIFAFPDRILAQSQNKPEMKITAEFFESDFLHKARQILFHDTALWHHIYDISTNGHEFGHTLWVDFTSEAQMNCDGEFKNIEEFKATCGGLVSYFYASQSDQSSQDTTLNALLSDTIRRAVSLIAWRESLEVRPYYCEGLIHLSGMFESNVLHFTADTSPKLNINTEFYPKLIAWYECTYRSLVKHYLAKSPAGEWLKQFVQYQDGQHHAINKQVQDFANHYWERYKLIGQEIL